MNIKVGWHGCQDTVQDFAIALSAKKDLNQHAQIPISIVRQPADYAHSDKKMTAITTRFYETRMRWLAQK